MKLKNYFIIPLTLAFIFSGCEIIREEGQNEKSALEYAAEDKAAKAAAGNDFMFLCRKKTNISGTYAGKTAYLISYNMGNHDTNVNNVGKAFLVKPGYLAAEADEGGDISSVPADLPDLRAKNGVEIIPYNYDRSLINDINDFAKSNVFRAQNVLDSSILDKKYYSVYAVGDKKNFWVSKNDNGSYEKREFILKASNSFCNVWYNDDIDFDNSYSEAGLASYLTEVLKKFTLIYSPEQKIFGNAKYTRPAASGFIDSPEKINILVFDLFSDAQPQQSGGILGYFAPIDMYSEQNIAAYNMQKGKNLKTNASEVFYIDAYFLKKDPALVYSTLAHEFQHMLRFIAKVIKHAKPTATWYDEMLSMLCEDIFAQTLESNVFAEDQGSLYRRLSSFNYNYNLGYVVWPGSGDRTLSAYGNAYAFGAYLARNYGGIDLIQEIALNDSVNEDSITAALQKLGYTDETCKTVFYKWAKAAVNTSTDSVSFNKSVSKVLDGKTFTMQAIDISSIYFTVPNVSMSDYSKAFTNRIERGLKSAKIYAPVVLKNGYRSDIGAFGFSIKELGKVDSSGSIVYINDNDMDKDIRMFLYLK